MLQSHSNDKVVAQLIGPLLRLKLFYLTHVHEHKFDVLKVVRKLITEQQMIVDYRVPLLMASFLFHLVLNFWTKIRFKKSLIGVLFLLHDYFSKYHFPVVYKCTLVLVFSSVGTTHLIFSFHFQSSSRRVNQHSDRLVPLARHWLPFYRDNTIIYF